MLAACRPGSRVPDGSNPAVSLHLRAMHMMRSLLIELLFFPNNNGYVCCFMFLNMSAVFMFLSMFAVYVSEHVCCFMFLKI